MALHIWDDAYLIGIAEIDQQHKDIFATFYGLYQAVRTGRSGEKIEPALLDLIKLSARHFQTEETLMAFHGFPDLNNHSAEHRLILGQLDLFLNEQRAHKPGLIIDLLEYVEDWQGIHVLQHDMKYRDYLMKQWGVQFSKESAGARRSDSRRNADERRFERLACSFPVEVRPLTDSAAVFAQCLNISLSGAFLRTWSPLKENTTATARFKLPQGTSDEVRICVRRSEPCIGMGVSFLGPLPPKLRDELRALEAANTAAHERATESTCEQLFHNCMLNITALEDVISETAISAETVDALRSLLSHTRNLERIAERHFQAN